MIKIVLFGHPLCEPCIALKGKLKEANIPFEEMVMPDLPEPIRNNVKKKILTVSRVAVATVPAVAVIRDGVEQWFSNHGQHDISDMFAEIQAAIT